MKSYQEQDFKEDLQTAKECWESGDADGAIAIYLQIVKINPNVAKAHNYLGVIHDAQGRVDEAISCYQRAIAINPDYAHAHNNLGVVFSKKDKIDQAIASYEKAVSLQPDFDLAYRNLVNLIIDKRPPSISHEQLLEISCQYIKYCRDQFPVRTLLNFLRVSSYCGIVSEKVQSFLIELEKYIGEGSDHYTKEDIEALYFTFPFALPNIRDSIALNNKTSQLVASIYKGQYLVASNIDCIENSKYETKAKQPLRIGFISPNFRRHSMGWCTADVIRELSKITPHIYLYLTGKSADDKTYLFNDIAAKLYCQHKPLEKNTPDIEEMALIEEIRKDNIDILIDLDSVTEPRHTHILAAKPSPYSLIWLGWDAPQMDSSHYFLVDRHTHPQGVNDYYVEKLLRMPDSLVAISGMERESVDREAYRHSLGIRPDQVVFLCIAPARKITLEMVKAQVEILRNVPGSILLQRGFGSVKMMQETYQNECQVQGVDINRYRFMPPESPEEKHRTIYVIADVLLDSYPFNGGTLSLETLWFDVPMVTRMGEQFFSRMGYSFLATLGIEEGIASNYEEYVEWGTKFGIDRELRKSVKGKLIQSKRPETLSPLWNPQKFAKDLYSILMGIVFQQEVGEVQFDYLQTAKDYWASGNTELAIANFIKALEVNPNLAEAHNQLGVIQAQQGSLDNAILYFQRAIAIDPEYADAHYNLGNALAESGQIEAAITSYEMSTNLQPDNINAYLNLGVVHLQYQDSEAAAFCYQMALEIDPNCIEAYQALANIFTNQGMLEESIECYQQALRAISATTSEESEKISNLATLEANLYLNLGNSFYLQEQLEQSLQAYQQALALNPNFEGLSFRIREIAWTLEIRSKVSEEQHTVLHVGCGRYSPTSLHPAFRTSEWQEIRFDIDPDVEPDIIGTLTDMEAVDSSSVNAIWSSHNIEHLYPHEVPIALGECYRALKPGGIVLITLPDIQKVAEYVAAGKLETPLYISPAGEIAALDILYGLGTSIANGNYYMAHRTGFTAETLKNKLMDAGFVNVEVCREDLNLWAKAYKPKD